VVAKLDRLARSVVHLGEIVEGLEAKSVGLRSLDLGLDATMATGKLMLKKITKLLSIDHSCDKTDYDHGTPRSHSTLICWSTTSLRFGSLNHTRPASSYDALFVMSKNWSAFAELQFVDGSSDSADGCFESAAHLPAHSNSSINAASFARLLR
jgi:hypothetical protein